MTIDNQCSRRAFLGMGIAAGTCGLTLPRRRLGEALRDGEAVLVVLQLSGGNDGLNTVVPMEDAEYPRARSRLAVPRKDVLPLGAGVGLHPSLKGLFELFGAGRLAIVQGVGYPNPNRSHFKSMDIWHAADPTGRDLRYGWLGRALDVAAEESPASGFAVNLAASSPLALNGVTTKPISFQDPAGYRFAAPEDVAMAHEKIVAGEPEAESPLLARLRRTAQEALRTSQLVRETVARYRTDQRYPAGPLASTLRMVAGLISGGLRSRVYYTYHGGFDTHNNQATRHQTLLTQLDQALTAFQQDLERQGVAERVVLMAFSEFGRRVQENASGGTDHGVAGPVFVLGRRVKGGLHGRHPSLTDLDRGDLRHTVDFRQVYASLLGGWMGIDARRVLQGEFSPLGLVGP